MKKIISIAILANSITLIGSYASLVAHYTLDETSGTNVTDNVGGTIGTLVVGGDLNVAGIDNSAFKTGSPAGITTPDGSLGISNDAARTISFWFNAASVAKRGRLIGMGDQAPAESLDITFESKTAGKSIGLRYGNGNYFWSGGDISLNNWHHVVLSYSGGGIEADGANRTIKLYIDGTLEDRDGGNNSNVGQALLTTDRFAIGQQTVGGYSADAIIDDVQVYNTVLTQNNVSFLQANPGLVIPEASTLGMFAAIGGGLLFIRRHR